MTNMKSPGVGWGKETGLQAGQWLDCPLPTSPPWASRRWGAAKGQRRGQKPPIRYYKNQLQPKKLALVWRRLPPEDAPSQSASRGAPWETRVDLWAVGHTGRGSVASASDDNEDTPLTSWYLSSFPQPFTFRAC